jgi:hypothetical protein
MTARLAEMLTPGEPPAGDPQPAPRPVEVINLGRIGSSTIRELELYETLGRRYGPDVVVLMFFVGNDLREILQEQDRDEARRWRPEGIVRRVAYALCPNLYLELALWKLQRDAARRLGPRSQDEVLAALDELAERAGADRRQARQRYLALPADIRSDLEQGLANDWDILTACADPGCLARSLNAEAAYFAAGWPRVERHLNQLREAVAGTGGRLLVVVIPAAVQVDPAAYAYAESLSYEVDPAWLTGEAPVQAALARWSEASGVPVCDPTADFRASTEPLYYPRDGHFNAAGQAAAARAVLDCLREHRLLPPPRTE